MLHQFTPDGLMIAYGIGAAFAVGIFYVLLRAAGNGGIVLLPGPLMFGWWGSAPFPWLMILAYDQRNNAALIAHERCHQEQQRRDGLLTFWWRYMTSKSWRLSYEVEAYKVWLRVAPEDEWIVCRMLAGSYDFDLTIEKARELLVADEWSKARP